MSVSPFQTGSKMLFTLYVIHDTLLNIMFLTVTEIQILSIIRIILPTSKHFWPSYLPTVQLVYSGPRVIRNLVHSFIFFFIPSKSPLSPMVNCMCIPIPVNTEYWTNFLIRIGNILGLITVFNLAVNYLIVCPCNYDQLTRTKLCPKHILAFMLK